MNVPEPSGDTLRPAGGGATSGPRDPGDARTLMMAGAGFVFFLI